MKRLLLCCSLLIAACSGVNVNQYAGSTPPLDLRSFLDGELVAYGLLQDRRGRMTRRFVATMQASWNGDTGTLAEQFRFDDGEQQQRTWTLTHVGDGRYVGTAGDVAGTASGSTAGAVFQWRYRLQVPWRNDSIEVSLDDWLYLIDERHLINRTRLTKFGFRVGELTLVIEKNGR